MSLDLPIFLGHVLGSLNLTVPMTTSHVVGACDNLLSYASENANVCFVSTKPINIVMKGVYLINYKRNAQSSKVSNTLSCERDMLNNGDCTSFLMRKL